MSRIMRSTALLTAIVMVFVLFLTGCGNGAKNEVTVQAEESTVSNQQETTASGTANQATVSGEKKKIVIVQENDMEHIVAEVNSVVTELEKAGYTKQNSDINILDLAGEEKKIQETTDKIKEIKPDVVINISANFAATSITKPLEGSGIPVLVNTLGLLENNDMAQGNVSGLLTMPKDMLEKAFEFLNGISPANNKKAVFITAPGTFSKEQVDKALSNLNIPLKAYEEYKYEEDYQKAILKYNSDAEVGWVLIGLYPTLSKGDKPIDFNKCLKWQQENYKKPSVTYWEVAVQLLCIPCGLAVDTSAMGAQTADMAVRVLKGEDIKNIKAESPKKINIILNQKAADKIGVKFPVDVLGSAYKIYTDFEGHYKGQSN